jgi:hypothetical protein
MGLVEVKLSSSTANARCAGSKMSPAMNLTGNDSGVEKNNLCPMSQKPGRWIWGDYDEWWSVLLEATRQGGQTVRFIGCDNIVNGISVVYNLSKIISHWKQHMVSSLNSKLHRSVGVPQQPTSR